MEYDRQVGNLQRDGTAEPELIRDPRPLGYNGGRISVGGGNIEFRSLFLWISELLRTTANANELRLELIIGRFDMPPAIRLDARRFLRFREKAFSGFAMSLMEEEEEASTRLVKDFDFPL